MMFNKDGTMEGYVYPKPSIEGGIVRSEPSPPALLSKENANKIREAVRNTNAPGPPRQSQPSR